MDCFVFGLKIAYCARRFFLSSSDSTTSLGKEKPPAITLTDWLEFPKLIVLSEAKRLLLADFELVSLYTELTEPMAA